MGTFVALKQSSTELVIDTPPKILDRYAQGGSKRSVKVSITGSPIVTEWPQAVSTQFLWLEWMVMTGAQAVIVKTLIDAGGLVTVRLYEGGSTQTCLWGPNEDQHIEPILGDYPDALRGGTAQLTDRTRCRVRLCLVKT